MKLAKCLFSLFATRLLLLCVFTIMTIITDGAFGFPSSPLSRGVDGSTATSSLHVAVDEYMFPYSEFEVKAMEELVLSLSKEPTDGARRDRLVKIFENEFAKPSESAHRFSALFDQVLIQVGDRVRTEAAEKFAKEEPPLPSFDTLGKKTPEELQVWALVDMMVSSVGVDTAFVKWRHDRSLKNDGGMIDFSISHGLRRFYIFYFDRFSQRPSSRDRVEHSEVKEVLGKEYRRETSLSSTN
jgi:hypothetical protein